MNKDIRLLIFQHDLRLWQVADKLGIHAVTLSNWLRHELPEDKKKIVLKAIEELISEKGTEV